jgi:hypothetical protein
LATRKSRGTTPNEVGQTVIAFARTQVVSNFYNTAGSTPTQSTPSVMPLLSLSASIWPPSTVLSPSSDGGGGKSEKLSAEVCTLASRLSAISRLLSEQRGRSFSGTSSERFMPWVGEVAEVARLRVNLRLGTRSRRNLRLHAGRHAHEQAHARKDILLDQNVQKLVSNS